jgi:hypothetical protein
MPGTTIKITQDQTSLSKAREPPQSFNVKSAHSYEDEGIGRFHIWFGCLF